MDSDLELGFNDLVISKKNGKFQAGGFMIKNTFLEQGGAPMITLNKNNMSGGSITGIFKDLAVPAGLLYLQQNTAERFYHNKNPEMMESSIFDKLLELSQDKSERKLTKKSKKQKTRKTRKKR